jgi:hypothetical protein
MLPLIAFGVGAYLGLYVNVLALLPFSAFAIAAFVFSSDASGQTFLNNAGFLLFPLISLQAGYMVGLTARDIYAQLRDRLNIGQTNRI